MTLVVDASMVVAGLTDSGADGRWAEALLAGDSLAAPHLMPVEAGNILRRAALAGDISADVASLAHTDLLDLRVDLANVYPGGHMDPEDLHLVQRRELGELVYYLNDTESLGVLLLGAPWSGKTTLLRMVEEVLKRQGRAVFFVSFVGLRYPGELGGQVLDAIAASPFKEADDDIGRTLRTSSGAPPLREAAAILRRAGARLPSPVLLLDGLDESVDPPRMAAAVEELSLALHGWKLVVSSRPAAVAEIRRFARFEVVQLRNLMVELPPSAQSARFIRTPEPGDVIQEDRHRLHWKSRSPAPPGEYLWDHQIDFLLLSVIANLLTRS